MKPVAIALTALVAGMATSDARAGEVFAGAAVHDINVEVGQCCTEGGTDIQFGARGAPIASLGKGELRPHVLGSVNIDHGSNFVAAGVSLRWPLGAHFYVQPGIGLAIHDGPGGDTPRRPDRIYFGSRVLFEPELTLGLRLNDRWAAELAYVHLSHGWIGGSQNPGVDTLGLRLAYRWGR